LKSRPQYSEKYQTLASFWAKRPVERRRKRERERRRREDRETRRRGDWERIGGLDDWEIGRLGD